MTTKSWKRLLWAVGIVSKGEGGFRLINDDTYLHARADAGFSSEMAQNGENH